MNSAPDDESSDPVLEALWKRVIESWYQDATHAALLDHALRVEALPEIAGRYRALVDDPEKGKVAQKRLEAIVVAATQLLISMKTQAPGKVPLPITLTAFALCALMLGWLALVLWGKS
jgi:hypothetical protein